MHNHRFIFTSDYDAICEDITCKYRYSKKEILQFLFEIANDEFAQLQNQTDNNTTVRTHQAQDNERINDAH